MRGGFRPGPCDLFRSSATLPCPCRCDLPLMPAPKPYPPTPTGPPHLGHVSALAACQCVLQAAVEGPGTGAEEGGYWQLVVCTARLQEVLRAEEGECSELAAQLGGREGITVAIQPHSGAWGWGAVSWLQRK